MRFLLIAGLMVSVPAGAEPSRSDEIVYVVKRGDTLIDLANRGFRRQVDYLVAQRRNKIANPRRLQPGSSLHIPVRILRTQPIGAKVVAFRGAALVAGSKPQVGTTIREGAVLQTGSDAFLAIELADGSLVTLPSRSRVKVTGLHRIILTGDTVKRFDLIEGRTETEVQKAKKPGDRFEIRTPVSVAAVRGTKFRVTYGDENATAGAGVLEGAVAVTAAAKSVDLPEGQGLVASASGPGDPVPLLPKPALENPDRLQDDELVSFTAAPVAGASVYRIQLAADAGFIETFAEAEAPTPALTFAGIPNGSFFARVSAISPQGIEGFASDYSFERRQNNVKAEVGEADTCPTKRCLRFRWRAGGEGERRFRFQLASRPGGIPIIDEPEMAGSEIVITDLPGGTYYWRVESSLIEAGKRHSKWTDYQELRVAPIRR